MAHASSDAHALNILARIAVNTKWSEVPDERLKEILNQSPVVLGEKFTEFLLEDAIPRKLITKIDIVIVPRSERFSQTAHFSKNLGPDAGVQIKEMGEVFEEAFLRPDIPEEEDTPETPVGIYELLYATRGTQVVEVLVAQDRRRSKLSTIWHFLEKQGQGQGGFLTLEGSNVFFVNDHKGRGRAVEVGWIRHNKSWYVGSTTMTKSDRWDKGTRFFCPDLGL